jgi:hypothetical protein
VLLKGGGTSGLRDRFPEQLEELEVTYRESSTRPGRKFTVANRIGTLLSAKKKQGEIDLVRLSEEAPDDWGSPRIAVWVTASTKARGTEEKAQSRNADAQVTAMRTVETLAEVMANIKTLEKLRTNSRQDLLNAYKNLIQRGKCFLLYESPTGVAFAPSRFIGYAKNDIEAHNANKAKDGTITNGALTIVLGAKPLRDFVFEGRYVDFCTQIGRIAPRVSRKYWATQEVLAALGQELEEKELAAIENDPTLGPTEKRRLSKTRIGQGEFRDRLLSYWKACCVTGCSNHSLLRASHIKPWCSSSNKERLDKFNGLLLSPNADALFDSGFISFSDRGKMIISSEIDEEIVKRLLGSLDVTINVSKKHYPYLHFHRNNRLRGTRKTRG